MVTVVEIVSSSNMQKPRFFPLRKAEGSPAETGPASSPLVDKLTGVDVYGGRVGTSPLSWIPAIARPSVEAFQICDVRHRVDYNVA